MSLDQFYTKKEVAKDLYSKLKQSINLEDYDILLEPSAGTGSFYNLLDKGKKEGVDLEPKCDGVKKMDFFNYKARDDKKYLVVGNPPFGRVSSIAVKFFNKAATFSDVIAFIVPRTFKRVSIQNKLDLNFHLIYNEDIPLTPCCFEPKMSAKCCFQVWIKKSKPRIKILMPKSHIDFTFIKLGPKGDNNQPTCPTTADFVMKAYGSNCGKIKKANTNLSPKSWHWIKSEIDIDVLIKRFEDLDYSISKDTVRQDSIGQGEVIILYSRKFQ